MAALLYNIVKRERRVARSKEIIMSVSNVESPALDVNARAGGRFKIDWLTHGAIALIFSGALLAYIQFAGPNIIDYDGYYHIKTAYLMRGQGVPLDFPYLKHTIMDEAGYTDPHMLLHVFQIPFTFLGDLRLAAKLAPIFFAAITFTVFYLVIWRWGIRYPIIWLVLLFASSSPFLYRMSMARGQSVSLAFQLIAFHLILKRSFKGLAILSLLFVWTYNAFPTLIPLVFFGMVVHYIGDKKIEFKLPLAAGAGIIAGHILNPYFPRNVLFIWDHIVPKLFATEYETSVGTEWYPYNSWALVTMSLVAIMSYVGGIILTNREEWAADKPRLFWFLVSTMYLALLFKSRRFVEYFPPSAIMFLAFSARQWLTRVDLTRLARTELRIAGVVAAAVLLWFAVQTTTEAARKDVQSEPASAAYRGGAEWLAKNTPPGSVIFHTDWDDFPMLFFYNTHNNYIVGLDPDFMRLKDEKLFRKYEEITLGKIKNPEDSILKDFGSEYVFTDNQHGDFIVNAEQNPRMQRVYSDRFTTVYRVLEQAIPGAAQPVEDQK